MKKKTFNTIWVLGILLLASCRGENIHDLDKPGEAVAIQQELIDEVGDLDT